MEGWVSYVASRWCRTHIPMFFMSVYYQSHINRPNMVNLKSSAASSYNVSSNGHITVFLAWTNRQNFSIKAVCLLKWSYMNATCLAKLLVSRSVVEHDETVKYFNESLICWNLRWQITLAFSLCNRQQYFADEIKKMKFYRKDQSEFSTT